ncbi:MAG: NAD(P)-dependent oxidoreductase [Enterocloster bolteae]
MVNEQDLYEACKNHVIAGAALDAVVHRTHSSGYAAGVITLDNVLITPHVGGNTVEAAMRTSYICNGNCEM